MLDFFFGKRYEQLSNADALKIILQGFAIVGLLAYGFGPTEYGLWGLMAKAANFFGVL